MIQVGPMRERVTIKAPTEVKARSGEVTLKWDATVAEVWASVMGLSSRDILQAQQANVILTHRIRIRYLPGITVQHRIIWRGRTMEIASVVERENRSMLEMLARELT